MTIREIIELLREQGHEVTTKERADGGLRITSIDGTKYQGSSGNAVARSMTGVTLSEARIQQLSAGRETLRLAKKHKTKVSKIDDSLKKEIARVQRIFRRNVDRKDGRPTRKNIRYVIENYGRKEAIKRLKEAERYARHLAYTEQVNWIVNVLEEIKKKLSSQYQAKFQTIINKIKSKMDIMPEEAIEGIIQYKYSWEKGDMSIDDFILSTNNILDRI